MEALGLRLGHFTVFGRTHSNLTCGYGCVAVEGVVCEDGDGCVDVTSVLDDVQSNGRTSSAERALVVF